VSLFKRRDDLPAQATPPTRVERFLGHLDSLSGGLEPEFFPTDSTTAGLKGVTAITYQDLPEPGMLTAVTYGLSLASHPEWVLGRPELCISVRSQDIAWARATAFIAEQMRGDCPFEYGNVLGFGDRMSEESLMTSFVVFAPAVLDRSDFLDIDVGDELPISIAGLYPIHESEREFIEAHGLEEFWRLDWDPYDVRRDPAA